MTIMPGGLEYRMHHVLKTHQSKAKSPWKLLGIKARVTTSYFFNERGKDEPTITNKC